MTALSAPRSTNRREGILHRDPVAAGVRIFLGALVLLDATGNATSNALGAGLKVRGRATATADNRSGLAGDHSVDSEAGVFEFAHDGSLTRAHVGKAVYVMDDQTLTATDKAGTLSATAVLDDLVGQVAVVRVGL